jgi:hypothetical protein
MEGSVYVGFLLGLIFDPEGGAICSSETSGCLRATRLYNPEDHTFHCSLWSENHVSDGWERLRAVTAAAVAINAM